MSETSGTNNKSEQLFKKKSLNEQQQQESSLNNNNVHFHRTLGIRPVYVDVQARYQDLH